MRRSRQIVKYRYKRQGIPCDRNLVQTCLRGLWEGRVKDAEVKIGMDSGMDLEQQGSHSGLMVALSKVVGDLVEENRGNAIGLVEVLRLLERLHRGITEGAFQDALPHNRQELYKLIRIIDEEGGWPHIPKMKLHTLYSHLIEPTEEEDSSQFIENP